MMVEHLPMDQGIYLLYFFAWKNYECLENGFMFAKKPNNNDKKN